jgi:hypothetical protein
MFEYDCQVCGCDHDQDNTHEGNYVHGGYGSTKYDETKLIWVGQVPSTLEKGGHICDDCIDKQIESGTLEAFSSVFDPDETNQMSAKGYAKVFELGAHDMYASCVAARGSIPEPVGPLTDEDLEAIEQLRSRICKDPSRSNYISISQNPQHGKLARDIGEAHVLAGLILGKIGGDAPDFSKAAEKFGHRLAEFDNYSCNLFDELMAAAATEEPDDGATAPS